MKKTPTDKDILKLAREYGKARLKYWQIYDDVDSVRGLDEFHPKSVAWENRLYKAEKKKDELKQDLLNAATEWSRKQ